MVPFTFTHATTSKDAINLLEQDPSAKPIAGGTNLLDLMKMYVETPQQLLDINTLNWNTVERRDNGAIHIGALVRNSDLAYHSLIVSAYPVLSQAILSGASPQLRNMATTGGNILQKTRCPYFYDVSFPCNKRVPGSGCSAIKGYNRSHAIFGTSDQCIATHPSDMCVAMAALDAVVLVEGKAGVRKIPFNDFHLLPGSTPQRENVLQHSELITAVELPGLPSGTRSGYLKIRDRASYDFALASAAVVLEVQNGTIRSARVAFGGVGTKPWRSDEAEKILTGATASVDTFKAAANAAVKDAKPYEFNAFKVELIKRTLIRALTTAGGLS